MKKKVKLFSTIASLCLAVALMAFGVMAATTETFKVTSSVSYSVTGQVNATITVQVKYTTGAVTIPTGEGFTGSVDSSAGDGFNAYKWEKSVKPGDSQTTGGQTIALGGYAFNSNAVNDNVIIYTITIKNNATEKLAVSVANGVKEVSTNPINVVVSGTELTSSKADVDAGKDFTYVVTYTLKDGSTGLTEALKFEPSFTLAVAQ